MLSGNCSADKRGVRGEGEVTEGKTQQTRGVRWRGIRRVKKCGAVRREGVVKLDG